MQSESGDLALGWEWCVKETINWRQYCRAGVMSKNEREEGEELFVWTVFLDLKTYSLLRVTVVREGMSTCEDKTKRKTLQSDGTKMTECATVPFSSK